LNSSNPTTPNCDEEEAEDDDLKNLNEDEQFRQKLARIQKRLEESHRHFLREIDRISKEEKALLEYCEELKEAGMIESVSKFLLNETIPYGA